MTTQWRKTSSLVPRRFDGAAASDLNLLELEQLPNRSSSGHHWLLLVLLILIHGGVLFYLVGVLHLPRPEMDSAAPPAIPVRIVQTQRQEALPKEDREPFRFAMRDSDREKPLKPRGEAADGSRGAPGPSKTDNVSGLRDQVSSRDPDEAVARPGNAAAALSSDADGAPDESASVDAFGSAESSGAAKPEPPAATAMAQNDAPSSKGKPEQTVRASDTTVAPSRSEPLFANDDRRVSEPAAPLEEARDKFGQTLASHKNEPWPEDLKPLPSAQGDEDRAQSYPQPASEAKEPRPDQSRPLSSPPLPREAPLPERRTIYAHEMARHETDLSANAQPSRSEARLSRRRLLNDYRATIRSHLASHKPRGGFGTDTVVVGFTLSRDGSVMNTRILESRGIYHLEQGTLNAVHRAAPYPQPPEPLKGSKFHFAVPFRFE